MNLEVRVAGSEDLGGIYKLIRDFAEFHGSFDHFHLEEQQMLDDKNLFQCLIAEVNGTPAGYAFFFFAYYSWSGKALYLDDLFVKDEFRRQGIGKKLLMEVINMAKAAKCKKVRWQVSRWNHDAIGFYKSIGAEIDEVEMNCNLNLY